MKLGQILKNILHELCALSWQNIKLYGRHIYSLQITINPKYIRAIEQMFNLALNDLKLKNSIYKNIGVIIHDDIFFSLIYDGAKLPSGLPNLFQQIESALAECSVYLANNWVIYDLQPTKYWRFDVEKFKHNYGEELLILACQSCNIEQVLHYLKNENFALKELDINYGFLEGKNIMLGKNTDLKRFTLTFLADLSPAHYSPIVKTKQIQNNLTNLCIKSLGRYFLFNQTLNDLSLYELPNKLVNAIEEQEMQHIKELDEMTSYQNKIIVYKTKSAYLADNQCFLIYSSRPSLHIGLVLDDELKILQCKDAVPCTHVLSTATLKYAGFKARLPTIDELHIIKDAISTKKAEFEYTFDEEEILAIIQQQIIDDNYQMAMQMK